MWSQWPKNWAQKVQNSERRVAGRSNLKQWNYGKWTQENKPMKPLHCKMFDLRKVFLKTNQRGTLSDERRDLLSSWAVEKTCFESKVKKCKLFGYFLDCCRNNCRPWVMKPTKLLLVAACFGKYKYKGLWLFNLDNKSPGAGREQSSGYSKAASGAIYNIVYHLKASLLSCSSKNQFFRIPANSLKMIHDGVHSWT